MTGTDAAASAELIADGGLGAASDDFFRSPAFLKAEGVTHTLTVTGASALLVAPVIVREITPGAPERDAISPYGYPGILSAGGLPPAKPEPGPRPATGMAAPTSTAAPQPVVPPEPGPAALDPDRIDWSRTGLVSLFIRHRLGSAPPLAGASARNTVQIADPALKRKSRMSDRQQVRKNREAGYAVRHIPGPQSTDADRAAFRSAYAETMDRTDAAPRYRFDPEYFDAILSSPQTWLFLVDAPAGAEGESPGGVAAASIAAVSDGAVHYYLSGTADAHLRQAPMKNLLTEMTDFAWERKMPLNLGGGITPGDRLEEFKRGFANRTETWHTSEIICDREAYNRLTAERLSRGRDPDPGFFPAYRAPS